VSDLFHGNFLLDTNIVVAIFEEDPTVNKRLNEVEQIYLPSLVLIVSCDNRKCPASMQITQTPFSAP